VRLEILFRGSVGSAAEAEEKVKGGEGEIFLLTVHWHTFDERAERVRRKKRRYIHSLQGGGMVSFCGCLRRGVLQGQGRERSRGTYTCKRGRDTCVGLNRGLGVFLGSLAISHMTMFVRPSKETFESQDSGERKESILLDCGRKVELGTCPIGKRHGLGEGSVSDRSEEAFRDGRKKMVPPWDVDCRSPGGSGRMLFNTPS